MTLRQLAHAALPVAIAAALAALLLHTLAAQAATEPRPPASGERFRSTQQWQAIEFTVWREATLAGATPAERELLLAIAWNETRGRPHLLGDQGCAWGLYQIHAGGLGSARQVCHTDARLVLPWAHDLPRAAFLDLPISTRAALDLLRLRGSRSNPDAALASYAGCRQPDGQCAALVLGRHAWWRATGLSGRFRELERRTVLPWALDDEDCECSLAVLGGAR